MESQLMVQAFPEEQKRRQHIIDNQIYGFATSGIAATLVRRQLYDDPTLVKNNLFHNCKGHSKRDTRSIQQYEI